jgi:hypothetical protein
MPSVESLRNPVAARPMPIRVTETADLLSDAVA